MGDAAAFWGHPFLRNLILQILLLHPSSLFLRLYTQAGITIDTIWLRKDWTYTFIFSFFRIINERMGKTLNIVWSLLTALVTLSTTGLMGVAVLTNHWEYITYSQSSVEALIYENNSSTSSSSSSISVKQIMDDRVIVVTTEDQNELLVRMHAGLWATCYDLTGKRGNMKCTTYIIGFYMILSENCSLLSMLNDKLHFTKQLLIGDLKQRKKVIIWRKMMFRKLLRNEKVFAAMFELHIQSWTRVVLQVC